MFKKLQVVVALLSMLSYSAAGTVSIGTASARGDIRVDNNAVKGNATLFDGSVVETGLATADLRLDKGAEITMSTSSRGTLYRDRLILQQGESELSAHSSFQVEANGLRVTSNQADSRGVVSLRKGSTVEVAALSGSFGVTNDHGVLLANVRPGRAISFAIKTGENPTSFQGVGVVSYENGHYYLTTGSNMKYELTCKDFKKYKDTKVEISGNLPSAIAQAGGGATPALCVNTIAINGASTTPWLLIGGVLVGAGVGIGLGVYESNKSTPPASR